MTFGGDLRKRLQSTYAAGPVFASAQSFWHRTGLQGFVPVCIGLWLSSVESRASCRQVTAKIGIALCSVFSNDAPMSHGGS